MTDCSIAHELLLLRRRLAWVQAELGDYFHATTDKQAVRDAVYEVIARHDFSIQATIMEKAKAYPNIKSSQARFYQHGWLYHFRHGMKKDIVTGDDVLIKAASIGVRKERKSFTGAVDNVMAQTLKANRWRTDFAPCVSDPCLQVADYCAWAIQKRWETGDSRSYDLIAAKINYEYDLWEHGTHLQY